MKHYNSKILFALPTAVAISFWGCGDSSSGVIINTNGMQEVDSIADLPECSTDNEGIKYWINDVTEVRICKNEEWQILRSSDIDPDTIFVRDTISEKDTIKVSSCNGEEFDKKTSVCYDNSILPICDSNNDSEIEESSNGKFYTCRNKQWHNATTIEAALNLKCNKDNDGDSKQYEYSSWTCDAQNGWVYDIDNITYDSIKYGDHVYKTVGIGSQMWFAENLNYYDTEKNPNLKGNAFCYGNDEKNCDSLGRLYNWATAMNLDTAYNNKEAGDLIKKVHQGICPDGWHIPSRTEWLTLSEFVHDNNPSIGTGTSLRSVNGWNDSSRKGDDTFGFNAVGAGSATASLEFTEKGVYSIMVVADELEGDESRDDGSGFTDDKLLPLRADLRYNEEELRILQSLSHKRTDYYSVRCLKD